MRAVKLQQLADDVMARLATRMREQLSAGDDCEGQAAEDLGDLDADPARVFAGAAPLPGAGAEVVVALDEVVGGLHQDGPQPAVAAAAQGPVGTIDLVALVARGQEAGAAGDGVGVEVQGGGVQPGGRVGDPDGIDCGYG